MLVTASKLIGGGLASIGVIGAGIGIVFGAYLISLIRNPSLQNELFSVSILSFALSEATALFALMMAFLILFSF